MSSKQKYENMGEELQRHNRRRNSRLLIQPCDSLLASAPIIDYSQEKILPINEACIPLVPIVNDILDYVSYALTFTVDEPAHDLTRDESASIRLYTMEWSGEHRSLYSILNETLRDSDREKLRPWFKYLKLFLTALVKIPCAPAQTVWRGIKLNITDRFVKGSEITWWAFSSTTTSLALLENDTYLGALGERTIFSIEAINGRDVSAHSHYDDENEILLLPGTYMEVQSMLHPGPDLHIIHLKQKVPDTVLLGLPFEGAHLYPKLKSSVRRWYKKKCYLIPMNILLILCIVGTILGLVLGTKSTTKPKVYCPPKSQEVCTFSTNYTMTFDGYYGTELLYINCSTALSNITVRFTVQKTVGATFAKQYNSFGHNLIQSYNETDSEIFYIWTSSPTETYRTNEDETYTEAQFQLNGINQTLVNDIYDISFRIACNGDLINATGHF